MEFLPFLLIALAIAALFLVVPSYYLTRLVLRVTLACYRDKTSAAAASGVRVAACVCFGIGLLTAISYFSSLGGSSRPFMFILGLVPLASHWAALAKPLTVKVAAPATAPAPAAPPDRSRDQGFTSFEL